MAEAVFENDIMVTTSNYIVKENRITKGVIVYDLANQTYKSITLLELQDKLIELSSSQKILNDIYDVVYDFENEIMALSFTTSFPEFGVMFVDLEANILEYHVFEGTEPPLDLFRIE